VNVISLTFSTITTFLIFFSLIVAISNLILTSGCYFLETIVVPFKRRYWKICKKFY
jgi:hypothetical protein